MSALLEIRNLFAGYSPSSNILQGISFSLNKGETVGVIGLNGSGKSTLAKALMGQIPYRVGEILFKGSSLMGAPTSALRKMGIAYMRQGGAVFGNLSVEANLWLAARTSTLRSKKSLPPLLKEKSKLQASRLSGGERQLLALYMALASDPELLILDEPGAGLSPAAFGQMYSQLRDMTVEKKITTLLIEQNVARAVELSSRIALVSNGKITTLPADFEIIKNAYFL